MKVTALENDDTYSLNVSIVTWLYCQGVQDTCKAMLKVVNAEILKARNGRKFRGRYLARYA